MKSKQSFRRNNSDLFLAMKDSAKSSSNNNYKKQREKVRLATPYNTDKIGGYVSSGGEEVMERKCSVDIMLDHSLDTLCRCVPCSCHWVRALDITSCGYASR